MKKTLWTFVMGMLLIFTSCQNEDDFSTQSLPQPPQLRTSHFYGVKSVEGQSELRGVAQVDKLWHNGTVITVKLLNDPYNMADSIKTWAAEWEEHANITFDFVASGNANVRIGFDWNDSKWITWSYTGTDCKYIRNQNEATVNFAFWDMASEVEKKADVLRAFGQVLGLELEHRHLSFDAGWSSRIQQYWEGEIEDIPWDELKEYVFDPIEERNLVQTEEYDANSIMIWPFDRRYATNTARDYNYELSELDIQFIKQLYPGKEFTKLVAVFEGNMGDAEIFDISIMTEGTASFILDIDNGKERIAAEAERNPYNNQCYLNYRIRPEESSIHTLKIYGNPKVVRRITLGGEDYSTIGTNYISFMDVSPCSELTGFNIYSLDFRTSDGQGADLNLSNFEKLEFFECSTSRSLKRINLLNNTVLRSANIARTPSLIEVNCFGSNSLQNINIYHEEPLILTNETYLRTFINNLPIVSRSQLSIEDEYIRDWVEPALNARGWSIYY